MRLSGAQQIWFDQGLLWYQVVGFLDHSWRDHSYWWGTQRLKKCKSLCSEARWPIGSSFLQFAEWNLDCWQDPWASQRNEGQRHLVYSMNCPLFLRSPQLWEPGRPMNWSRWLYCCFHLIPSNIFDFWTDSWCWCWVWVPFLGCE